MVSFCVLIDNLHVYVLIKVAVGVLFWFGFFHP